LITYRASGFIFPTVKEVPSFDPVIKKAISFFRLRIGFIEVIYASPERMMISHMAIPGKYVIYACRDVYISVPTKISPKIKNASATKKRKTKIKKILRRRKFINNDGIKYFCRISHIPYRSKIWHIKTSIPPIFSHLTNRKKPLLC